MSKNEIKNIQKMLEDIAVGPNDLSKGLILYSSKDNESLEVTNNIVSTMESFSGRLIPKLLCVKTINIDTSIDIKAREISEFGDIDFVILSFGAEHIFSRSALETIGYIKTHCGEVKWVDATQEYDESNTLEVNSNPIGLKSEDSGMTLDEVEARSIKLIKDLLKSCEGKNPSILDICDHSEGVDSHAELRKVICASMKTVLTGRQRFGFRSLEAKSKTCGGVLYSDIDCVMLTCPISELDIDVIKTIIGMIKRNGKLIIVSMVESEVRDVTRFLTRVSLEAMGGYEDTLELDDETDDIIEKKSEPVMTLSDFDEDYSLTVTFAGDVELRCDWSELSENIGYIKFLSDYAYYCLAEAGEPMHPIQMYASGIEDLSELFDRAVYYADRIRCVNRDEFEGNTEAQTIALASQLMMPILSDMCYSHKYETRPFICRYKIRELVSESEIYKNLRISCKDNNTFNCATMGSLIGGDLAIFASNVGYYRYSMNMYDIDKLEDIKESFL